MFRMMRKHGITLALFAALTTGLTALVHALTEPTIARQAVFQQQQLLDQVVPPELHDNDMLGECYLVVDASLGNAHPHRVYVARKNGRPVAAAIEATAPDGYSGSIQLLIGADFAGNVLGTRVTEHHETPGLGDKIELRISDWITHFSGKTLESPDDKNWAVKKDGGQFDQFTGATITPRAVVNAVKRTAGYLKMMPGEIDNLPRCGDNADE
ncbi:electron transport complex subunit RsxG [Acerihabitans arboris]|uniref:Ion-translocating oxidoreductase complex subunit G n=1 Tax=Acerihabitans arboris TaxID=2691583 RepID=A0A845SKK0_9GAMM|nr:electron transport complex subunit RsxG [Acerihabitans arboris]NDL63108.1 electron transport complex subunit RsxG [Acerihabitans arboris]